MINQTLYARGWNLAARSPSNQEELAYTLLTSATCFLRSLLSRLGPGCRPRRGGLPAMPGMWWATCWALTAP